MLHRRIGICIGVALAGCLLASERCSAQVDPQMDPTGRSILFIRGADGSGGGASGGNFQQRTAHLSDINDQSIAAGNTAFGKLKDLLVKDGFTVSQLIESKTPITLAGLSRHRVVVMGSNNKVYTASEIKAFHDYIDKGGSALFISDANWGPTWEAAPASDNQFLHRYGAHVWQDCGGSPILSRSEKGRYLDLQHPVLSGPDGNGGSSDIGKYEGEGVSLFEIRQGSNGYQATAVVSAIQLQKRLNTNNGKAGTLVATGPKDCAMWFAEKGDSRLVGHFDRNTFFNPGGAGSSISRFDNKQLALNLLRYLASTKASVTSRGKSCGLSPKLQLTATAAVLGRVMSLRLSGALAKQAGLILLSPGPAKNQSLPGLCKLQPSVSSLLALAAPLTDSSGSWIVPWLVPEDLRLSSAFVTLQALLLRPAGPVLGFAELSNGLELRVGYSR